MNDFQNVVEGMIIFVFLSLAAFLFLAVGSVFINYS